MRDFSTNDMGEKWISVITHIKTGEGCFYLTVIMDLADRKLIGWSMNNSMSAANRCGRMENCYKDAKLEIFDYIEVCYNTKRRHSALDYLTPVQVENEMMKNKTEAA